MEEPETQPEPQPETQPEKVFVSPADDPLVIGEPGDSLLSPAEVLEIINIRHNMLHCSDIRTDILRGSTGIKCMSPSPRAFLYPPNTSTKDQILCVPNKDFERSIALSNSRDALLISCSPLPLSMPNEMNHKDPRFKVPGRVAFWQLVLEVYAF
ncbi:hypothetical protein BDV06DRAFT_223397 [Aspergillus oleicola]